MQAGETQTELLCYIGEWASWKRLAYDVGLVKQNGHLLQMWTAKVQVSLRIHCSITQTGHGKPSAKEPMHI